MESISRYIAELEKQMATGLATEHTYRPALQSLIESFRKGISATNEPTRIACGAPDFIVMEGPNTTGYIEAKDIGTNLDEVERSEQLVRYLDALPNLILTDYLVFRLYRDKERVFEARLGHVTPDGRARKDRAGSEALEELFASFLSASFPVATTPRMLAERMAGIARILCGVIQRALEGDPGEGTLHGQLEAFRKVLLHDLKAEEFADMYAQTICYGLFAARCQHKDSRGPFTREVAVYELPETNPFLREMFGHIAGPNLDKRLSWAVDHLIQLLDRAGIDEVLRDFGRRTRQEDPVVHFYETFLKEYDPGLREMRGVYYTPEPVVSYIVRSVDAILKRDFGLKEGLADQGKMPVYEMHLAKGASHAVRKKNGEIHRVLILDPATGTGTFLHGVVDHIHEAVLKRGGAGLWNGYVSEHLLPRLFGFELLMAPYAVAHMKMGIQLLETGYAFQSGERLRIYLTNTLEEAFQHTGLPLFADIIAKEANAAGEIKTKHPVMVILGNPPYSGHSANKSEWITDLMRGKERATGLGSASYFEADGQPLNERNPKWLNDDYVKFIRFAQWRIEKTGHGVLAFISNHGYLDNPTFRGMRQSLLRAFDDIYILDLHGNTKKKEVAPGGGKDENVFDIQQGVAIGIFVKRPDGDPEKPATVRHAELWGLREIHEGAKGPARKLTGGKYHSLYHSDVRTTAWNTLKPADPFYLFAPRDVTLQEEYGRGWSLTAIMPANSVGIVTARDKLAVHWTNQETWDTIKKFISLNPEDARERYDLGKDALDWKVAWAQEDVRSSGPSRSNIREILYRPFDTRWTYYTGQSSGFLCRPRKEVMRHMLDGENLGLITTRSIEIGRGWEHVFCSRNIVQHHSVSIKEVNYLFPLYLYPNGDDAAEDIEQWAVREEMAKYGQVRSANLSKAFMAETARRTKLDFVPDGSGDLKKTFGPENVFHYIYALLHSPSYRRRYADFLKSDFPRVPVPPGRPVFRQLCGLGAHLTRAHLLEEVPESSLRYPETGENLVDVPHYADSQRRIYINKTQYFEGLSPAIWDFHIGGYQPCHKWLKDRKGRTLSYDEITHYMKMASAIAETIRFMNDIDQVIEKQGGWPALLASAPKRLK